MKAGLPLYPDLCRFIGVDDTNLPEERTHNPGGTIRSKWLRTALMEPMIWKEPFKLVIPPRLRIKLSYYLKNWNRVTPKNLIRMPEELNNRCRKRFYDDVRLLEDLLDRDLQAVWF